MNKKPDWFDKHPCIGYSTGYVECAQGLVMSLMCCQDCDHPTKRESPKPYTDEEIAEMWEYRNARIDASSERSS